MNIKRIVFVFNRRNDKLVKEVSANDLKLSTIKQLFTPYDDDPSFYRPYKLDRKRYEELVKHLPELKLYPYDDFEFDLEAVSV